MKELELKYGCNPNQKPSRIYMNDGSELPIEVLCGRPGYINFLDAFNGWQLVSDLIFTFNKRKCSFLADFRKCGKINIVASAGVNKGRDRKSVV